MALIRVSKASGGQPVETNLWTNPTPTASTFAAQDVTLSEDIDDFDYIKITWCASPSEDAENSIYVTPAALKASVSGGSTSSPVSEIIIGSQITSFLYRRIHYLTDTSVNITVAYQQGGSQTGAGWVIPISIKGVKY